MKYMREVLHHTNLTKESNKTSSINIYPVQPCFPVATGFRFLAVRTRLTKLISLTIRYL